MSRNKNKKKYKYCMNDVSYYNSINNKDRNNLNNVNKLRKRKTKYDKNEKVMFHKRFSSYNMGSARKEKALSKKAKKREKLWKRNKKKREKKRMHRKFKCGKNGNKFMCNEKIKGKHI